jgi:chaperonin GroEL (HSP60 family)
MLQGIAILTGGKAITEGLDIHLKNIQLSDLGQAAKITIGKNNTVVEVRATYDQRIRILAPPQAKTGAEGMAMYRNEALLQTLSERISDCSAAD